MKGDIYLTEHKLLFYRLKYYGRLNQIDTTPTPCYVPISILVKGGKYSFLYVIFVEWNKTNENETKKKF